MSYCAPGNKGGQTCFTINSLRKIASAYNQKMAQSPSDMIKFNGSTSKMQLWNSLRQKLSSQCETEFCWLDLDFVKSLRDPELEGGHRPKGPHKGYEWLKTSDINKAIKQYERVYPDFVFFGPVPLDFAEINTELQNLDLARLYKNGIRSIGIVFNMDPHTQGGSHWVAMFVKLDPSTPQISYFDSFGICPPPKEIQRLINSLNQSGMQLFGKPMFINCNTYRHQFSNSECGVYSMYFIVESLKGRSFNQVATKIIVDDEINKYRSLFFRPERAH